MTPRRYMSPAWTLAHSLQDALCVHLAGQDLVEALALKARILARTADMQARYPRPGLFEPQVAASVADDLTLARVAAAAADEFGERAVAAQEACPVEGVTN